MEEDEDAELDVLHMKIRAAELAANKRKRAAQAAAATEVQGPPPVEAARAAWQAVEEKQAARAVEADTARAAQAKTARAAQEETRTKTARAEAETERLRLTALEGTKTQHQLPIGAVPAGISRGEGGWNQERARRNTTAKREIDACNDARQENQSVKRKMEVREEG